METSLATPMSFDERLQGSERQYFENEKCHYPRRSSLYIHIYIYIYFFSVKKNCYHDYPHFFCFSRPSYVVTYCICIYMFLFFCIPSPTSRSDSFKSYGSNWPYYPDDHPDHHHEDMYHPETSSPSNLGTHDTPCRRHRHLSPENDLSSPPQAPTTYWTSIYQQTTTTRTNPRPGVGLSVEILTRPRLTGGRRRQRVQDWARSV